MNATYRVLALLIAVGVVVQAMAIALAWFTVLKDVDGGAVYDKNTEYNLGQSLHGMVGMIAMPLLALLLMIVSFFARIPGGVKWAAIVLGLVILQIALAFVSWAAPAIGALHGANALALLAVAGMAGRRAATVEAVPADGTTLGSEATA